MRTTVTQHAYDFLSHACGIHYIGGVEDII
ncbi:protein of unknown function [Pararobbsia alpina]